MAKKRLKEHRIDTEWCKGCGICVAFCPKTVLALDGKEKAVAADLKKIYRKAQNRLKDLDFGV